MTQRLTAKDILKRARTRLISEDCPFWGILCMDMDLIEDESGEQCSGTLSTDGKSIWYYPPFIEQHSIGEVEFFLAHESGGHKGLLHHVRLRELMMKETVDLKTFNEAADYVANLILVDAKIGKPPKGLLYDPRFAGLNVEQVYRILMKEKQQQPAPSTPSSGSQTTSFDPGQCGGVLPAPADQLPDLKEFEADAKADIRKAVQASRKAGNLPNGLRQFVERLLEPKVDWRSLLREYAEEKARNDYSWYRPNKRFLPHNLYMPTLDSRELGEIVVMIDASGSITDNQAQALLSEVTGLAQEYPNTTIHLIFFATSATDPIEITDADDVLKTKNLQLRIGSGTDYKPPFDKIKNLSPVLTVILTDGYCGSFPKGPPSSSVLWIINNRDRFVPPFGEVIRMVDYER